MLPLCPGLVVGASLSLIKFLHCAVRLYVVQISLLMMPVRRHAASASPARQSILHSTRHLPSHRRTRNLSSTTLQRPPSGAEVSARTNLRRTSPRSRTSSSGMAVFQRQKGFFVTLSLWFIFIASYMWRQANVLLIIIVITIQGEPKNVPTRNYNISKMRVYFCAKFC